MCTRENIENIKLKWKIVKKNKAKPFRISADLIK